MPDKNLFHSSAISKHFFVGITLANSSNTESGICVLDSNLDIVTLDKLYSMTDVQFFIDNFPGKQNAVFLVSLPDNPAMLSTKWRVQSKPYQLVNTNRLMKNRDEWCNRLSNRGCDYFLELKNKGLDIFRFDVRALKHSLGLSLAFKEHSPVDCKHLQSALKVKFAMKELPNNMVPVAQLEGILGAFLAHKMYFEELNKDYKVLFTHKELDVIGLC